MTELPLVDEAEGTAKAARRHVYLCPLRWADMDSFGHVNNVVYLRYLEQARVDWMFETAREAGVDKFSLGTVVTRHEIDYKRPLVYRAAPVRVEIWVTKISVASFVCAYDVRDDDTVYAATAGPTPTSRTDAVLSKCSSRSR